MDYRSEVQSLIRGLQVLEAVNRKPGLVTAEIAVACNLPRTTTHRALTTLTQHGFVRRDEWTLGYLPTGRVLQLAAGFDPTARLTETARSVLEEMTTVVNWPMHFSMPDHFDMRIRASTDRMTPLAVQKLKPGQAIPVLQCAAGLAWLASQPECERNKIVDATIPAPGEVMWKRPQLESTLVETQRRGYALFRRPQRYSAMIGLSVPVRIGGHVDAALSVRFAERALPVAAAREKFLPHLVAAAARLEATR